ncbi:MAG: TolC family protein [Candidatus Omnitrophica bacterium]|nr:TolC family protein [Candidatus Omnitrophota bacterium]
MNRPSGDSPLFLIFIFLLPILMLSSFSDPAWPMAKRPPAEAGTPGEFSAAPAEDHTSQKPEVPKLLTLEDCFEQARKRSETLAIKEEAVKETTAQFLKATSEALGDVDFEMTRQLQQETVASDPSSVGRALADPDRLESKFTISQPIFQGFKSLGALAGAGNLRKQRKAEWLREKELLFLEVAGVFYRILRLHKEHETLERTHELFRERIRELEAREAIGRSRSSEVLTAQARMKLIDSDRARLQGDLNRAKHIFEFLVGVPAEADQLQEEEIKEPGREELTRLLLQVNERSDVKAAERALKVARQNVTVAQSELWPEVTLEHNQWQRREGSQPDIEWDTLFKVTVPLFRGGETAGKVKEAWSQWKKARLNYRLVKRKAVLDVKEAFELWASSLRVARLLEEARTASEENYKVQKEEYSRNLVSNLDVLEALEGFHSTAREALQAHYEMKQNYRALEVAAGSVP